MKYSILSSLIVLTLVSFPLSAEEEITYLDLNHCEMKVGQIQEVKSIQGDRGKVLKPSRRDAKLIEVEFLGVTESGGTTGIFPQGFSVLCTYRRSAKIFPSAAVGVKHAKPDGELSEYWLNEEGASMMMKYSPGEKIRFFAVFEVPENAEDFLVQYPVLLNQ